MTRRRIAAVLAAFIVASCTSAGPQGREPEPVPTTDPAQTVQMMWEATDDGFVVAAVAFDSPDERRYSGGAFVVGDLEFEIKYTNDAREADADGTAEAERLLSLPVGGAGTDVFAAGMGKVPCDRINDGVRLRLSWTDDAGQRHLQECLPSNPEGFVEAARSLCE